MRRLAASLGACAMRDELATVLRLVSEGKLSPEEAAPIIEAFSRVPGAPRSGIGPDRRPEPGVELPRIREGGTVREARQLRIRVTERGRQVVNLRIPMAFANTALRMVPGLSSEQSDQIRAAIAGGSSGPILDVEDEDGDGVVISME
jgi:hypothetical protein